MDEKCDTASLNLRGLRSGKGLQALGAHRRPGGFSLLEILVTVVILGALAALLFPFTKGVLAKSRQAVCAGNLRQIAALQMMYCADNNGSFMPWANDSGNYWRAWFHEYVKDEKSMLCPAHFYKDGDGIKCSYGYNGSLGNFGRKAATVPSRTIMWIDASAYLATSDAYAGKYQYRQWIGRWHSEGSNLAFVDGHVEWWPFEKIYNDADLPLDEQHFYIP